MLALRSGGLRAVTADASGAVERDSRAAAAALRYTRAMRAPGLLASALTLLLGAALALLANCGAPAGGCGNMECVCAAGDACDYECDAPPCNPICEQGSVCTAECANGECLCGPGSNCDFDCEAPPCHVTCDQGTVCTGVCANGDCTCGPGSDCDFDCDAGPCHVTCDQGTACTGVCANGTCTCGPSSVCEFTCLDDNCHFNCEAGSVCLVHCAPGTAGESCNFDSCATGPQEVCPSSDVITCGMSCPG